MRLYSALAAAALLTASLAAHADSMLTETFTANGSAGGVIYDRQDVQTTSFQQFDPALGVLNSVTLYLSGTATPSLNDDVRFAGLRTADNRLTLTYGTGSSNGSAFNFSVTNGTDTYTGALPYFYGKGTINLLADFLVNSNNENVTTSGTTGSITYNYTAATPVAATPEPSSLALLGTGLLGAVGVARKRFAQ